MHSVRRKLKRVPLLEYDGKFHRCFLPSLEKALGQAFMHGLGKEEFVT
jgi:hypothetical protein